MNNSTKLKQLGKLVSSDGYVVEYPVARDNKRSMIRYKSNKSYMYRGWKATHNISLISDGTIVVESRNTWKSYSVKFNSYKEASSYFDWILLVNGIDSISIDNSNDDSVLVKVVRNSLVIDNYKFNKILVSNIIKLLK